MPDVDNTEEFRCISLCSGYAGLELGVKRVIPVLRTMCYVEVEAFACANLVAKIEEDKLDAAPIWTDIKTFNGQPFRDRIYIITAGYPCQGESHAGKRLGQSDPRWLWPHIERIIETVRPVWFFGENVSGHLNLGFPTVYRSLRNLGYKVEAGLFTAEEVGAPHKRERVFVLAHSESHKLQGFTAERFEQGGIARTHKEMVNSNSRRLEGSNPEGQRWNDAMRTSELAITTSKRTQRSEPEGTAQAGRQVDQQGYQWPSRPGRPQYEWEEPRVVDNSTSKYDRKQYRNQQSENEAIKSRRQANGRDTESSATSQGQAQSRLGRAVNGTAGRVDRLRLLGNGVVPQQVEKAFRELIKLF